ncbi:hypothetical protein MD484_g2727, partial [Candolleomyces efflorescens]
MSLPPRPKYEGTSRRLLLAFDIGTTFSGISYSILDPGKVPEIRPVTRYPSQVHVGGDSKIPTVIYYDEDGIPCAIGAETLKEGIEADAEEYNWSKAYWFKLHLRPSSKTSKADRDEIPPLPPNKTVVQVFTDYMKYLHQCAKIYISDTHGNMLWRSLENEIVYVLTHPNGWEGRQQATMRQAAILAGFIPDTVEGRSRVLFVTEGEASLHFCLTNGLTINGNGNSYSGVLIVDAGGGTIDVTAYRKLSDHTFEEIAIPKCYFQGAVYVTSRAKTYFEGFLSGSRFLDDVPTLATRFDRATKHVFRRDDEPHHIQFATQRERDPDLNIRAGRITVPGRIVATFFDPSISCIIEAIKLQKRISHFPIETSPFSWWVASQPATGYSRKFAMRSNLLELTSYDPIIMFTEKKEYKQSFCLPLLNSDSDGRAFAVRVFSYKGDRSNPKWLIDEPDEYDMECIVKADTSMVKRERHISYPEGQIHVYYTLDFEIVLLFGLTELKAQIAYVEDGVEKRGPATVLYDKEGSPAWDQTRHVI